MYQRWEEGGEGESEVWSWFYSEVGRGLSQRGGRGDVPLNIMFYILKSGADLTLKDDVCIREGEGKGECVEPEGRRGRCTTGPYVLHSALWC